MQHFFGFFVRQELGLFLETTKDLSNKLLSGIRAWQKHLCLMQKNMQISCPFFLLPDLKSSYPTI